jgi:4-hydroxy-tetrahydrodipicolinate reductase
MGIGDVSGTSGFKDDDMRSLREAKGARVVISPNMSIGMNILFDLAQRVSSLVGDSYDAEIVELHHRWKKDAPSGSALKIKDAVLAGQSSRQWTEVFGREGMVGERKKDEIGIMSIRGGDIVGEHTLCFAGIGERLELTHKAWSRDNFARGGLLAARWLVKQSPGIYSMKDVLGL